MILQVSSPETPGMSMSRRIRSGTVSYTHLDVYKRQPVERSTMMAERIGGLLGWSVQSINCTLWSARSALATWATGCWPRPVISESSVPIAGRVPVGWVAGPLASASLGYSLSFAFVLG